MGILLSPSVFATDINVEFTATVKATTCNITLTGNNVTNDGNNNYTLRIPKEGANKWGNFSRLTQSFHFFMFEPIFSPVNALNQPI